MPLLTVKNVCRHDNNVLALNDVSFNQLKNEKIAIAGETGSGKTSLLKVIAGLLQPSAGDVLLHGKRVEGPDEKLLPGHSKIAYLSQHFELRNNYLVQEELESKNLLTPLAASKIYEVCEITHLLKRKTNQLSGGERQRIVLARLLTTNPDLLLLDEPYSNLDIPHKKTIKSVIENIMYEFGTTCILVSHEPTDLLSWADRIIVMKNGRIIQSGEPYDLYYHSESEYAAGLLGTYNIFNEALKKHFDTNIRIIRPEQLYLSNYIEKDMIATIVQIHFMGPFSFAEVRVGDQILWVRINNGQYYPLQQVAINLAEELFPLRR